MDAQKINLYDLLVELSGLDRNVIDQELGVLIQKLNLDPKNLSTDDIRRIAALYLFEIQSSNGDEWALCKSPFLSDKGSPFPAEA